MTAFYKRTVSCLTAFSLNQLCIKPWVLIVLSLLLLGCPYRIWEPVNSEVEFPSFRVSMDFASGWHRYYDGSDDLLMSYDGLTLQNIRIRDVPIVEKTAAGATMAAPNMSPQNLAKWVANSSPGDVQLESRRVLESTFSTIAGNDGMRLLVSGQTRKGLRYNQLYYVYFQPKNLFVFSYTAVAHHYFDRDLPIFEKIRSSFKKT